MVECPKCGYPYASSSHCPKCGAGEKEISQPRERPLARLVEAEERIAKEKGTNKEGTERGTAKERGTNKGKTVVVERGQKEGKGGWLRRASQKVKATERPGVARISLFIFLMLVGAFDILIKRVVGYEPTTSALISIGVGIIFFLAVRSNPFYWKLVVGAFILDVVVSQGLLLYLPENELKNILIAIKVFIWLILAILLFVLEVFNHLAEGEKLPLVADLVLLLIIGVVVFFLFPQIISTYEVQAQSHEEYFEVAKTEVGKVTKSLEETKNAWSDYLSCTFQMTEGGEMSSCLAEKKNERYCREQEEMEYNKCLEEMKKKKFLVGGAEDPMVKQPTKIEFKVGEYFPTVTYRQKGYEPSSLSYPIELRIENPRAPQQKIDLEVSCKFKKGNKEIEGEIAPQEMFVGLEQKEETKSFVCTPSESLEGIYALVYTAKISHLQTISRLTRAFIGTKTEEEKKELIPKLKNTYFTGNRHLSQAPVEFGRLNFGLGEPETNPIIEAEDNLLLVSTIENTGRGKILKVNNYQIDLPGFGISQGELGCLQKTGEVILPEKGARGEMIPLPACFMELPGELGEVEDFILREFTATLDYDYQIEKEIRIEVKLTELSS